MMTAAHVQGKGHGVRVSVSFVGLVTHICTHVPRVPCYPLPYSALCPAECSAVGSATVLSLTCESVTCDGNNFGTQTVEGARSCPSL